MSTQATHRIAERFHSLSPAEQRLVYQKIHEQGMSIGQFPIIPMKGVAESSSQPLSYAQARQWFLWQLEPASSAYHIADGLLLKGKLDRDALQASFDTLIERHAGLRTVFRATSDGTAEQIILPPQPLVIPLHDLSQAEPAQRTSLAQAHAQRLTRIPFNLDAGPLLRVELIRLSPEEHILVVVMHHIITDGWSLQVVVDELVACYRARLEGKSAQLPGLSIEYSDYSRWQRNWLEAGEKDRQLAYWTTQLDGEQPVLQLPTDHPRSATARYTAARHSFVLPVALQKKLRTCAESQGATIFMVLLAGFQALLHRYTGLEDIRVGVPIANRHRVETERVVGLFVNTQVLRNQVQGRMPLRQILEQAKDAALGAQAHQDLPFEQLVEALQPERSLGHSPLFQVLFNHQRIDYRNLNRVPGLDLEAYEIGGKLAQFELMLDVREYVDRDPEMMFTYGVELFDADTIARLARHYVSMLEQFVLDADRPLEAVEFLGTEEARQLKAWGNRIPCRVDGTSLHEQIEHQAQHNPDAVALIFGEEELSYRELNARANRIAHHLITLGAGPETKVGIAVERSLDMVAGLLGTLKSGAAYVPLDPDYPQERLDYMVADSGIELVLTQRAMKHKLPASLHHLELDMLDLSDQPDHNPDVPLHADSLAYVIYTSGSTGKPKGAQLSHGNVMRLLKATEPWFHFDAHDVWTMFHSYAFDFSVWEIFGALCHGGKLVIVPYLLSRSPQEFLQLLRRHQVTILNQTPSAFGQLIRVPELYAEDSISLRAVIFGGEALEPESLRPWIEHFGDQSPQLINMYGITETTVHVTYYPVSGSQIGMQRSLIGHQIPDLSLRVLDSQLQPLPVGVPGELHVGGAGLARGYLNRPGLSAERFIADPFDTQGGRLYRTGDLVRWRADGQLEYLGRIDQQVKIRGFRIELGEIEAQLLAQAEVKEAVVIVQQQGDTARLVAYVAGTSGGTLSSFDLKEHLKRVLPDYMVPSAIVVLEQLPLTANGKVDRRALPQPAYESEQAYEAPQNEIEQMLAAIWIRMLGIERVGRHDNFFELGGHSLLAVQMVAHAQNELGAHVTIAEVFQNPTLVSLAARIASARESANDESFSELDAFIDSLEVN